ncbi:MAG: FHA domain-containing protein [Fuerstiella sp.]
MSVSSFQAGAALSSDVVAELTIVNPPFCDSSRALLAGQRLVIGSDPGADIRLIDDEVAAAHCVLTGESGCVVVKDCFSQAGTFVDRVRIREVKLTADAYIQIGAAVISVRVNRPPSTALLQQTPRTAEPPAAVDVPDSLPDESLERESPFQAIDAMQAKLDDAYAEIEVLQNRLAAVAASSASTTTASSEFGNDPFQEEMIELLRAEVMELQAALEERQLLTEPASSPENVDSDDDHYLAAADADRLVTRLEQLLQELEKKDGQVATLTDLLAATEEASRAVQDEKRNLNLWLEDIEARFGDREKDWQSQREKLQQRLDEATAERDLAAMAVTTDSSSAKLEAAQTLMAGLRATVETQRQQLAESQRTIAQLRSESSSQRPHASREDLVRLSEERAEIARQRQELEALRAQERQSGATETNLKLKALRQHLNEIHEQEAAEREEKKLSSRIARLWSRLEGRS